MVYTQAGNFLPREKYTSHDPTPTEVNKFCTGFTVDLIALMLFLPPVNHKHHHLNFLFKTQLAPDNFYSREEKYVNILLILTV